MNPQPLETLPDVRQDNRWKIARVKLIAAELRQMFPCMNSVTLECREGKEELTMHGIKTYSDATEFLRSFGIGNRNKIPYCDPTIGNYTQLSGEINNVRVVTYPNELPPSCKIVTEVERIPKQQTVDTGEFIEVERKKVVCGEMEAA